MLAHVNSVVLHPKGFYYQAGDSSFVDGKCEQSLILCQTMKSVPTKKVENETVLNNQFGQIKDT